MSSIFDSSAIVNKLDVSLFVPANRLSSTTGDALFSQDFKSILQESIKRDTQQPNVSNSATDITQERRYEVDRNSEVASSESQREYLEQAEQYRDSQTERSSIKEDDPQTQTDDSNEQNTEENYAGQDTSEQDNVKQDEDASASDTAQASQEEGQAEQKPENESDDTPADLTVASDMIDVQQQTEELSDAGTLELGEELTEEITDELASDETEDASGAFEDTLSQIVESSTTDNQIGEGETVGDGSANTADLTDTQTAGNPEIDQLGEKVSSDAVGGEQQLDTKNVQTDQTVNSAAQDDASIVQKTTEQATESTESTDLNLENTDESLEQADDLLDESLEDDSSEDTAFRYQNMNQEKNVHQEKNSADAKFAINETTTPEEIQQVQSGEGQTDALKDVTIEQIIQEKTPVSEGTQQLSDSELKKEVDLISGIDTGKGKETAESTQIKQEAVNRSQDYRADEQEIVRQVQARLNLRTMGDVNQSEIKFSLYPKQLGEVAMKLVMQDNTLIAKMKVDNESVKQVLESNMAELRKNLSNQGVKVEKIEVTVKSDTQTMGSFDDRRANSHAEQKSNYDYVTSGSHQFKKGSADTAEQAAKKTIFSQQQAVTSDGRLNYLA